MQYVFKIAAIVLSLLWVLLTCLIVVNGALVLINVFLPNPIQPIFSYTFQSTVSRSKFDFYIFSSIVFGVTNIVLGIVLLERALIGFIHRIQFFEDDFYIIRRGTLKPGRARLTDQELLPKTAPQKVSLKGSPYIPRAIDLKTGQPIEKKPLSAPHPEPKHPPRPEKPPAPKITKTPPKPEPVKPAPTPPPASPKPKVKKPSFITRFKSDWQQKRLEKAEAKKIKAQSKAFEKEKANKQALEAEKRKPENEQLTKKLFKEDEAPKIMQEVKKEPAPEQPIKNQEKEEIIESKPQDEETRFIFGQEKDVKELKSLSKEFTESLKPKGFFGRRKEKKKEKKEEPKPEPEEIDIDEPPKKKEDEESTFHFESF